MSKKSIYSGWLLISLLTLSTGLKGQETELDVFLIPKLGMTLDQAGSGSKASAMGKSFTAVADDPTAVAWNPAGLVRSNTSSAYLAGRFGFGSLSADATMVFQESNDLTGTDRAAFYLNYIGFSVPLHADDRKIVGGVSVRSLSDFAGTSEWIVTDKISNNSTKYQTEVGGGLYALTPAIGIDLRPNLSLGISLNFMTGRNNLKYNVIKTNNQTSDESWQEYKNKFSGSSIEMGILWRVLPNFSFGSKLSFPYNLNVASLEYSNSDGDAGKFDADISLRFPTRFAFGLAIKPSHDFLLALDYRVNPIAKGLLKINEYEHDRIFDSVHSFHTGVEYVIKTETSLLPLRFGFYIDPTQLYEYNAEAPDLKGDRIIRNNLTAGMGVIMKNFSLEFSVDYNLMQYDAIGFGSLPFQTDQPFKINHSKFRFTLSSIVYLQ